LNLLVPPSSATVGGTALPVATSPIAESVLLDLMPKQNVWQFLLVREYQCKYL